MTALEHASQFLTAGIAIIPVGYRDKRPRFDLLPEIDGHREWEPYKTTLPTERDLAHWQTITPNYGVVAGWSGLMMLDFDAIDEYTRWLFWATKTGGIASYVARNAYRVSSSRGMHVYIRLPYRIKNRKAGKIDIKGDGYVLGPGSIHPSGVEYRAMRDVLNFPLVQALSDVLPAALLTPILSGGQAQAQTWTQPTPQRVAPAAGLVAKIKNSYSVESFFPGAQKSGPHHLLTLCPLHDDHHPSFWVDTSKQICGCFAGCNDKPMDVINLYARIHGLNNQDAIFALSQGLC